MVFIIFGPFQVMLISLTISIDVLLC